jgi:hypothetical protein
MTSVDKILDGFPIQTLPQIVGEPTYTSLTTLHKLLKTNAASVETTRGGGLLGHLALVMPPAAYNIRSGGQAFIPAVNPGPIYQVPVGGPNLTAATSQQNVRAHEEQLREYNIHNNIDKELKRQLIAAIEPEFFAAIMDEDTGYATTTTMDIITHLYTTYGRIQPHDLEENDRRFKTTYDPNLPFETFIKQINDAAAYAEAGNIPYTETQKVTNAYNLLFQTGLFPEACRTWRTNDVPGYHTWQHFQRDFRLAHTDWKNVRNTSQQAGYQQANHLIETFATETAEAITHLTNAASVDRDIVKTLTTLVATQEAELAKLRTQIATLTNKETPK